MVKTKQVARKKAKRVVVDGIVYIYSSFNNTLITFTDRQGNVIAWSTSGSNGYRGSRKSTPYAAQIAAEAAADRALEYGLKNVDVLVKGPGPGRESAVRSISSKGIKVTSIADITPLPHNGCRPAKRRRV
jgi:small subunit ribosomal protein S11